MPGEITERRQVFSGTAVTLERHSIRLADGRSVEQEVVVHRPSVGMVPVDHRGQVLLVRQFRAPAASDLLEIPAGSVDPGEDLEQAAQRELQEEVGVRAGLLRLLGRFYLAPGYCTELMSAYLAEDLTASSLQPDDDELIEVERLSLSEALAEIETGRIQDAKTIASLLLYQRTMRP
jgi:ADP-ribose pyrophosphatase